MLHYIAKTVILVIISIAMTACGGGSSTGSSSTGGGSTGGGSTGGGSTGGGTGTTTPTSVPAIIIEDAFSTSSITWIPPVTYNDNSPLSPTDIGGYRIYVGTNLTNMVLISDISDIATTEFSFASLGKGIRYIAVSSYDISGIESSLSAVIAVNIS